MKLILLPGFDGTGKMFRPFLPYVSGSFIPEVVTYPSSGTQTYASLVPLVRSILPTTEPFILLAESFSGPLAVQIAAQKPHNLKALILCSSFLSSPRYVPRSLRAALAAAAFKLPRLNFLFCYFLLGSSADRELVSLMKESLSDIKTETLASRLEAILGIDVTSLMGQVSVPIFYLYPTSDKVVPRRAREELLSFPVQSAGIHGPHCLLQVEPKESYEHINEFMVRCISNDGSGQKIAN